MEGVRLKLRNSSVLVVKKLNIDLTNFLITAYRNTSNPVEKYGLPLQEVFDKYKFYVKSDIMTLMRSEFNLDTTVNSIDLKKYRPEFNKRSNIREGMLVVTDGTEELNNLVHGWAIGVQSKENVFTEIILNGEHILDKPRRGKKPNVI